MTGQGSVSPHLYIYTTPTDSGGMKFNVIITEHKRLQSSSVAGFPSRRPGFEPRSGHVAYVLNKVALNQVFF
jgi:hypothetical protein